MWHWKLSCKLWNGNRKKIHTYSHRHTQNRLCVKRTRILIAIQNHQRRVCVRLSFICWIGFWYGVCVHCFFFFFSLLPLISQKAHICANGMRVYHNKCVPMCVEEKKLCTLIPCIHAFFIFADVSFNCIYACALSVFNTCCIFCCCFFYFSTNRSYAFCVVYQLFSAAVMIINKHSRTNNRFIFSKFACACDWIRRKKMTVT